MISLSMIVKNEEQNLRTCLDSVKDVVDEIIIVDTGSTDRTKEIAEMYNARLYDFTWVNDFAAARNYSLSKCTGDWILYLDADEMLNKKSIIELKKIKSANYNSAFNCKIINIDEVNKRPSIMTYVRLFPNKAGLEFNGKVHEQIEKSLIDNKVKIVESNIEIIHTGYSREKDELKSKALRNIEILKDEYENSKSSYYAFHIGQSYNILENTEEAIAFFKLALEDNNLKKEYRSTALRVLAVYKSENNLIDEAQQYINEAIKSDKQQPMNYMVAAQLCEKLGNQNEQLSFIKEALVTNQSYSDSTYKSSQNIFIDDYLIVCSGIKAALLSGIAEDINYFWNELQLVGNKDLELKPAIEVINNLLKGELNELKVDDILRCINNSNLELMVTLFKIHSDISFIEKTFEELHNRDADNLYVLRELALHQFNKGNLEKAELLFEKAISKNVPDPSIYFYLISVILQNNQIEKLPGILTLVVERFGDNPEVISKLNILQQKLQNLQGSVC